MNFYAVATIAFKTFTDLITYGMSRCFYESTDWQCKESVMFLNHGEWFKLDDASQFGRILLGIMMDELLSTSASSRLKD